MLQSCCTPCQRVDRWIEKKVMADQQKELERIALREFLRVRGISPVVLDGPEPPDFSLALVDGGSGWS